MIVAWPIDRMVRVSLRTVVLDVPPQDVITRDNVTVKVNAVVYFRVMDPLKAVVSVENYLYATSQEAQTTLRSILGQAHLDQLLSEREQLGQMLQEVIDLHTDPWGVKVTQVAVKAVDLPQEMQRAMAKQAESEREKRAKIIHASGELEASKQLSEAASALAARAGLAAPALPADARRDRGREELDHHLPAADRLDEGADGAEVPARGPRRSGRPRLMGEPGRPSGDDEGLILRGEIENTSVPELIRSVLGSGETGVLTFRKGDITKSRPPAHGPGGVRAQQQPRRASRREPAAARQDQRSASTWRPAG